jgi:hypothetical protein
MCRLLHPMQGGSEAAFALRPHPSVALEMVARLEDFSSGAPQKQYL